MVKKCCIQGCKNESFAGCKISFHCIPKNEELRKKWLAVIPANITKHSVVCSAHFKPEAYTTARSRQVLKAQAVPSIFIMDTLKKECRTCLGMIEGETDVVDLFSKWHEPWIGMQTTVAIDLQMLANVSVSLADQYSKYLCKVCFQKLHTSCLFVAQVKDSDTIMRNRLNDVCPTLPIDEEWPKPISVEKSVNPEFENMDVEVKEEVLSDNEFEDNGCGTTEDLVHPTLDIKIEPEEIQETPQIVVNGSYSIRDEDYPTIVPTEETNGGADCNFDEEYLDQVAKEEPVSEEDSRSDMPMDLPLDCLLCAKSFKSVSGLKAHVISQHSYKTVKRKAGVASPIKSQKTEKHTCATCRRCFTTSTDLMVHETCHNKSVCYSCNCNFDTFEQLSKHREQCSVSNSQELPKVKTLEDVIRPQIELPLQKPEGETKEPLLKCDLCEEEFSDNYYMNIHKEIHHSITTEESGRSEIKLTLGADNVKDGLGEVENSEDSYMDNNNLVNVGNADVVYGENSDLVNQNEKMDSHEGSLEFSNSGVKLCISEVKVEYDDLQYDCSKADSGDKLNSDDEKMETELENIFGV